MSLPSSTGINEEDSRGGKVDWEAVKRASINQQQTSREKQQISREAAKQIQENTQRRIKTRSKLEKAQKKLYRQSSMYDKRIRNPNPEPKTSLNIHRNTLPYMMK